MRAVATFAAAFLFALGAGAEAWAITHGGGQPLTWVAFVGMALGAVGLCLGYVRDRRSDTPRR